jgi:hypothetical protein
MKSEYESEFAGIALRGSGSEDLVDKTLDA